jgi:hypothetical protein
MFSRLLVFASDHVPSFPQSHLLLAFNVLPAEHDTKAAVPSVEKRGTLLSPPPENETEPDDTLIGQSQSWPAQEALAV